MRDHLKLLVALTRPRHKTSLDADEVPVSLDALSFYFQLLSEQLDEILKRTQQPDHW
uniref:XAC0095 family protein n=1 Tax=Xanthomonas cannabis TaxID=1885674 RepID=UPI003F4C5493